MIFDLTQLVTLWRLPQDATTVTSHLRLPTEHLTWPLCGQGAAQRNESPPRLQPVVLCMYDRIGHSTLSVQPGPSCSFCREVSLRLSFEGLLVLGTTLIAVAWISRSPFSEQSHLFLEQTALLHTASGHWSPPSNCPLGMKSQGLSGRRSKF